MRSFYKHPLETYPIGVDYTGKAPAGALLVSSTWSATDLNDGTDATTLVLQSSVGVIAGQVAKARVESGTLNHEYRLSVAATFDTSDVLHDNIYMKIDVEG